MNLTSYDQTYARKMLKNTDEIASLNELLFIHDEVITEFVRVACEKCDDTRVSPQVIVNPFGYGTEGAVLLEQHHTCNKCGSDSKVLEPIYELLLRVKEYDVYETLDTVV